MNSIIGSLMTNNEDDKLYVDDVFSTYLYTGNGSTQTINNGIDLAGKGGLVWIKGRSGMSSHYLFDTNRGYGKYLQTQSTAAAGNVGEAQSFKSSGFSIGGSGELNANGSLLTSWTFRKAKKFFDIVTYTGNGVVGRQIAHNLGCEVGMIVVKCTSVAESWVVYHRTQGIAYAELESTGAFYYGDVRWGSQLHSDTYFSLDDHVAVNGNGRSYVAYLFAHNTSADGLIQCGSYVGNGSANGTVVNLGFEPQYLMIKCSSWSQPWVTLDVIRGMSDTSGSELRPNSSTVEQVSSAFAILPTANGFTIRTSDGELNTNGQTYIYMAIRRPNKHVTSGTQVYNAIARTGTGVATTVNGVGFATDLLLTRSRNGTNNSGIYDRLRGTHKALSSDTIGSEYNDTAGILSFSMDGMLLGIDNMTGYSNSLNSYSNL